MLDPSKIKVKKKKNTPKEKSKISNWTREEAAAGSNLRCMDRKERILVTEVRRISWIRNHLWCEVEIP